MADSLATASDSLEEACK